MSTPRTTGSEEITPQITLAEWAKLSMRLLAKLGGKRPQFWFRAIKALDRKENPFIASESIRKHDKRCYTPRSETSIKQLEGEGISIFPSITKILSDTRNRFGAHPAPERSIVSVRMSDMFTLEELRTVSYDDILAIASEKHGLEPCYLQDGLSAFCEIALSRKSADPSEPARSYLICVPQAFQLEDETDDMHVQRIPMMSVFSGSMRHFGPDKQGHVTLYKVGNDLQKSPQLAVVGISNSQIGPETRLIFTSIAE